MVAMDKVGLSIMMVVMIMCNITLMVAMVTWAIILLAELGHLVVTFGNVKSYYGYLIIIDCYILCQVTMGIMVAMVTRGFISVVAIICYG